jgi:hypothetical protein
LRNFFTKETFGSSFTEEMLCHVNERPHYNNEKLK